MRRLPAFVLVVVLTGLATLFGGVEPAVAKAPQRAPSPCSTEEWRDPAQWDRCVGSLPDIADSRAQCLKEPTPNAPDSGMAGWFASRPDTAKGSNVIGRYGRYGYAGYSYTTYDIGCVPTAMHPDYKFENTVANGEFLIATSVLGASNALRERAWDPKAMWGWADPLVEQATDAVYHKVFTVFGAITLGVVGLYLLWRSRQSDMSAAMTTAGWAIVVMVGVTAVALWPVYSANVADKVLVSSLAVVHDAVGPPAEDVSPCPLPDPNSCKDNRPPALRASDTATEGLLLRPWLRGMFGSADTETAKKYGPILYDAKSLSWADMEEIRNDKSTDQTARKRILEQKRQRWMKVAEQIKTEDPEAYEYLQGTRGMDRIGAGFIAILAAVFFALFDLTASVLVLLGFLIFRWAVVAAPVLGTVGLLRPASAGIRRLVNAVVAAIFNIIIFGAGAAIYLFAVSLIIKTDSLPGWLQVVLILLTGVVGWLLLRPYRRITQLGGKDTSRAITTLVFLRERRRTNVEEAGRDRSGATQRAPLALETRTRPEGRSEDATVPERAPQATPPSATPDRAEAKPVRAAEPVTASDRTPRWTEPDDGDSPTRYAIYRPSSRPAPATPTRPESEPARR